MNDYPIDDAVDSTQPFQLEDPHQSKIDPDDPRLRISKPKGRSLKKGPVKALVVAVVGLIALAIILALLPAALRSNNKEIKEDEPVAKAENTMPDFIKNAPGNDAPIPQPPMPEVVPALGEPLPGDLGNAMVEPAKKPTPNKPAPGPRQPTQAEKDLAKAKKAGLFFPGASLPLDSDQPTASAQQGVDKVIQAYEKSMDRMANGSGAGLSAADLSSAAGPLLSPPDQNKQNEKNKFLQGGGARNDGYVKSNLAKPISPYEIKAGTVIPVSLITGLNSDLPGEIIGQVRENVYDTVSGNHLLIPQGTRLMAAYDSVVSYGQNRVLVCWNRMLRPDGSSLNLECMPGVDLDGFAGFTGEVDNHYLRLIGGVLISSFLSATATKSQGSNLGDDLTFDQVFASNVGGNINDVGQQITSKNLEVQPTIKVPAGDSVNVLVNKDMIIPPYELP